MEKKRLEEAGEAEAAATGGMTRTQLDKEKRVKRLQKESARALKQKHAQVEKDIADTEELISELERQMGLPEIYSNPAESSRVAREHRDAQEKLERLYEDWEDLSEAVAAL